MNIFIRKLIESDLNFILSSFLNSFRKSHLAKDVNNSTYFQFLEANIKNKLRNSTTYVACNPDDVSQIFGYIIADKYQDNITAIHYVYVKEIYRELRICSKLIEKLEIDENTKVFNTVLAESPRAKSICKKLNAVYNPFIFLK